MTTRVKSTTDEYLESMSPKERAEFDRDLRNLALSELVLAAMRGDAISVGEFANIADVSAAVAQALLLEDKKDDFSLKTVFRILDELGFKVYLELEDDMIPLKISWIVN